MANEDLAADEIAAAPPREDTRFSRPLRYVVRALVFLALIGFLGFILQQGLIKAFMTNPGLNGLIAGALLVGVLVALRELWRLSSEARAATRLAAAPRHADIRRGEVIAPLGSVLPALDEGTLAPSQASTIVESIAVRLDDGREVLRYLAGLLVFLGLLCSVFAFVVQLWAVRRTSAARASMLMGTEPVWALVVGVTLGGEAIGVVGIGGAALIVAASYAGQAIERRHRLGRREAAGEPHRTARAVSGTDGATRWSRRGRSARRPDPTAPSAAPTARTPSPERA